MDELLYIKNRCNLCGVYGHFRRNFPNKTQAQS